MRNEFDDAVTEVTVRVYGSLNDFLPPQRRQITWPHVVGRRQSVKDLIESLGVPHPEIDLILANGISVPFDYAVQNADRIAVYPRFTNVDIATRRWPRPISDILTDKGLEGLQALPGVGESIARAIRDILARGRLAMLERLRGESDPAKLLASVPGIGRATADRLHEELGLETLEDLEAAAHDGRLEQVVGLGQKRLAGIRDSLAHRLSRVRPPAASARNGPPSVQEILDVDREYREKAASGQLVKIAPRRFNPAHDPWLPILHTTRGRRHYTALFSNTAFAHRLGRTNDWVVIYSDDGRGERQYTVITAGSGPLQGRRIVRGREAECVDGSRATRNARSAL